MGYARLAGFVAAAVSFVLMAVVVVREVGFNPLNGWTILLGFVAAVVLLRAEHASDARIAAAVLIVGLVPALIGGMGLLYVPALVLAVAGARTLPHRPAAA